MRLRLFSASPSPQTRIWNESTGSSWRKEKSPWTQSSATSCGDLPKARQARPIQYEAPCPRSPSSCSRSMTRFGRGTPASLIPSMPIRRRTVRSTVTVERSSSSSTVWRTIAAAASLASQTFCSSKCSSAMLSPCSDIRAFMFRYQTLYCFLLFQRDLTLLRQARDFRCKFAASP